MNGYNKTFLKDHEIEFQKELKRERVIALKLCYRERLEEFFYDKTKISWREYFDDEGRLYFYEVLDFKNGRHVCG